jgi:hypothetical protein
MDITAFEQINNNFSMFVVLWEIHWLTHWVSIFAPWDVSSLLSWTEKSSWKQNKEKLFEKQIKKVSFLQ